MRPIDKVMDAVLKLIPNDFEKRSFLQNEFENLKEAAKAAGGDQQQYVWMDLGELLNRVIGEPDTEWKENVALLIQGKKDYNEVLNG